MSYTENHTLHVSAVRTYPDTIVILKLRKYFVSVGVFGMYRSNSVCGRFGNKFKGQLLDFISEIRRLICHAVNLRVSAARSFYLVQSCINLSEDTDRRCKGSLSAFHIPEHICQIEIHGLDLSVVYSVDRRRSKHYHRHSGRTCQNLLRAGYHNISAAFLHIERIGQKRRYTVAHIEELVLSAEPADHFGVIEYTCGRFIYIYKQSRKRLIVVFIKHFFCELLTVSELQRSMRHTVDLTELDKSVTEAAAVDYKNLILSRKAIHNDRFH